MDKKIIAQVALFLYFIICCSCSNFSNPSEKDGKNFLKDYMEKGVGLHTVVDVVQFKEVNAKDGEKDGIKIYIMQYKATAVCDGNCVFRELMPGEKYSPMLAGCKDGQKIQSQGNLYFEKTKKGWIVEPLRSRVAFEGSKNIDMEIQRQRSMEEFREMMPKSILK